MLKIIGDGYKCNGRKIVLKNSTRTYTTYKHDMSVEGVEGDALKIRLIDKYRDYRTIKIDEIDHIECVNLAI